MTGMPRYSGLFPGPHEPPGSVFHKVTVAPRRSMPRACSPSRHPRPRRASRTTAPTPRPASPGPTRCGSKVPSGRAVRSDPSGDPRPRALRCEAPRRHRRARRRRWMGLDDRGRAGDVPGDGHRGPAQGRAPTTVHRVGGEEGQLSSRWSVPVTAVPGCGLHTSTRSRRPGDTAAASWRGTARARRRIWRRAELARMRPTVGSPRWCTAWAVTRAWAAARSQRPAGRGHGWRGQVPDGLTLASRDI